MKTNIDDCTWNHNYHAILSDGSVDDWSEFYPDLVNFHSIDIVQEAADFYLLFGICNNAIFDVPNMPETDHDTIMAAAKKLGLTKSEIASRNDIVQQILEKTSTYELNIICNQANDLFSDLIEKLDAVFFQYGSAACGGELRHHSATDCLGHGNGIGPRFAAWTRWGEIYRDNGVEAFVEMQKLFLDFPKGSYGGPKWADAAKLMHDRELNLLAPSIMENKIMFIDRVFNMQHNTGCFLNKLEWINLRTNRQNANEHFQGMGETVLAAHAANPANLDDLHARASKDVQQLVSSAMDLVVKNSIPYNGIWTKGSNNG